MKWVIKKTYIIVSILCCSLIWEMPIYAAETKVEEKDIEQFSEEIEELIPFSSVNLIKKDGIYYFTYANTKVPFLYDVIKTIENGNYIYILSSQTKDSIKNNYLVKYDQKTKKENAIQVFMDEVADIILYNDSIVVGGEKNNNVCLEVFNSKFEFINEITLAGEGYQKCTNFLTMNNHLYLFGVKSAHTTNKYFSNVGNKGEIKSFIFSLDNEFNIENKCYLNEQLPNEKIIDAIIFNNNICLFLKAEKNYIMELDENLNLIYKTLNSFDNCKLIYSPKQKSDGYLLVVNKDYYFSILSYNSKNYKTIINIEGSYLNSKIIDGELIVYYVNNGCTYKKIIKEYHINYINKLECNYYKNDETIMEHFDIDSYFEDLVFKIDSISPNYEKNNPGSYIITYKCIRENNEILQFEIPFKMDGYVNITNDGIYPKGTRLFFFGKGYLNDEPVPSGVIMQKCGTNVLKICDANGAISEYTFEVIEGYYKDSTEINIKPNYTLNCCETFYIKVNSNIKNIYNKYGKVGNIQIINDNKFLELIAPSSPGISNIEINEIELEDGRIINTNNNIIIKTLKSNPSYEIDEIMNGNNLDLSVNVVDNDQIINDVYLECYQNQKLVYSNFTYIKNKIGKLESIIPNIPFEIYVKVKNENGSVDTLFYYKGELLKKLSPDYQFNFTIENGRITNINFKINISQKNINHLQITIGSYDMPQLLNKYTINNNYIIVYLSIIISTILIGILTFVLVKKKKSSNHQE